MRRIYTGPKWSGDDITVTLHKRDYRLLLRVAKAADDLAVQGGQNAHYRLVDALEALNKPRKQP